MVGGGGGGGGGGCGGGGGGGAGVGMVVGGWGALYPFWGACGSFIYL